MRVSRPGLEWNISVPFMHVDKVCIFALLEMESKIYIAKIPNSLHQSRFQKDFCNTFYQFHQNHSSEIFLSEGEQTRTSALISVLTKNWPSCFDNDLKTYGHQMTNHNAGAI